MCRIGFTTKDLAFNLQMGERYAQKIVADLCKVNLAEYIGEESPHSRERPIKVGHGGSWGQVICPKNVVNNKKVNNHLQTASQLLVVPNNWGAVQIDCEAISFNNGLV